MEKPINLEEAVKRIRARDNRYQEDLYRFIMEGLEFTLLQQGEFRHISAKELIGGLCTYAKEIYGMMALTFLNNWGIFTTGDIGRAVFHLIDEGVLARQEDERVEDFEDVLDLRETLEERYFG